MASKINRILDGHVMKLFSDQKQNPSFCYFVKPGITDSMYSLFSENYESQQVT